VTVAAYCFIDGENDENGFVTFTGAQVYYETGENVDRWFENFAVTPPIENVRSPENVVAPANFFLPNIRQYIENTPVPPTSFPPEIENFVDIWIWGSRGWIPAKKVLVSFDISPEAYTGRYKLYLNFSIRPVVQEEETSICVSNSARIDLRVTGRAPPPPPIPTWLTGMLIFAVLLMALILLKMRRRIRV
jgi:hypothetical protein